ncbi:MAG: hypothetical protein HY093_03320 [Candidatus Liptonbacteria bacterium]|nr:hypothetical protein [Candidatus Liptonbacteria bacterium]
MGRVLAYTIIGAIVGIGLSFLIGGRIANFITPMFGSYPDYIGSIPVTRYKVSGLYVLTGVAIFLISICALAGAFIGSKLNKKS